MALALATLAPLTANAAAATDAAPVPPAESALRAALERGVSFLLERQLEHGEFQTFACLEPQLSSCRFESSPFVTAFAVNGLSAVSDPRAAKAIERALDFLADEALADGTWRYYGRRDGKAIPPDLDDTSVVAFELARHGRDGRPNGAAFDANRRSDGVYRTWLPDESSAEANRIHAALASEVDCAVNANVLRYLRRSEAGACDFVVRALRSAESCSGWYPDRLAALYMAARARAAGVTCLAALDRDVLTQVALRRRDDGSFGDPLATALAVNALLDTGKSGPMVAAGVRSLLATQRDDGSWPRATFFRGPTTFYGSEEATTALALEGLAGYLSAISGAAPEP